MGKEQDIMRRLRKAMDKELDEILKEQDDAEAKGTPGIFLAGKGLRAKIGGIGRSFGNAYRELKTQGQIAEVESTVKNLQKMRERDQKLVEELAKKQGINAEELATMLSQAENNKTNGD